MAFTCCIYFHMVSLCLIIIGVLMLLLSVFILSSSGSWMLFLSSRHFHSFEHSMIISLQCLNSVTDCSLTFKLESRGHYAHRLCRKHWNSSVSASVGGQCEICESLYSTVIDCIQASSACGLTSVAAVNGRSPKKQGIFPISVGKLSQLHLVNQHGE